MQDKPSRFRPRWILAALLGLIAVGAVWLVAETAVLADKHGSDSEKGAGVMATVGDVAITEDELSELLASDLKRLDRERHELLERGLENLITEKLLESEASARGVSVDELIDQEIESGLAEVTDEQVDAFYEAQKSRIPQPKEQVAEQIKEYLSSQQRQEAQQKLVADLRGKYPVKSFLEPMRIEVDSANSPAVGPADAPVVIVEFSDFQCPFCSRVVPTLNQIKDAYGDKVRLAFRQFPLHRLHPQAQKAAEASLCANDQGKFWEMHDAMFADQSALAVDKLKETASGLGLDAEAFAECLDSDRHADQVDEDLQAGMEAGVTGTPAMFINGRFLSGAQPYENLAKVIDEELGRSEG